MHERLDGCISKVSLLSTKFYLPMWVFKNKIDGRVYPIYLFGNVIIFYYANNR
jgi:hypothetical protein